MAKNPQKLIIWLRPYYICLFPVFLFAGTTSLLDSNTKVTSQKQTLLLMYFSVYDILVSELNGPIYTKWTHKSSLGAEVRTPFSSQNFPFDLRVAKWFVVLVELIFRSDPSRRKSSPMFNIFGPVLMVLLPVTLCQTLWSCWTQFSRSL